MTQINMINADLKGQTYGAIYHIKSYKSASSAFYPFLRPSKIFKNDRVRISANESPVANASSSLIAPQFSPRRK